MDLLDLLDGGAARLGALLGRKLTSASPGQVGCACREVEPSRTRWRNGLLVVTDSGVSFRTRGAQMELNRKSLDFDESRRPQLRDRLWLGEGDRIYRARTVDGRLVEIAVGRGRAAIVAALDSFGGAE